MLVNNNGVYDHQVYIPLGLLYIAACLERSGYNVDFADYQTFSAAHLFDADQLINCLNDPGPVIGISCMSNLLPYTVHLARKLKTAFPDRRIVLGGAGPSPVANEVVAAFPFIDSVGRGEGEINMLEIMQGNLARVPKPRVPADLDGLPLPAYSLLDFGLYAAAPSLITSRGCPYHCAFCTEPDHFGGGGVRFRGVERVLQEIELLHGLSGREMFLFQDDILPLNLSRFQRLLAGLRRLSFRIQWKCFSRVDLMTEDLMAEMARSGCVQVRYGVESGSNRTLERIKKGFAIERAYELAVKSLEYFPSVHASFIWGYPFEELADFEQTLEWVERFEEAGISVLLFEYAPLPGSPLHRAYRDNMVFSRDRYSFFVVTGHEVVKKGGYETSLELEPVYRMIQEHPEVFAGFYRHESASMLGLRERFGQYQLTRRTRVKNQYDL